MLDAAKAMKLSAKDLLKLEIIDEVIPEPVGGAHRDRNLILDNVRNAISKNLEEFSNMTAEEIINNRKNKFLRIGRGDGFINNLDELSSLKIQKGNLTKIIENKKILLLSAAILIILGLLIKILN